jgi:hypothetical protein
MIEIKVTEIRLLGDDRPVKAFVDVQIGDWIIYDWRILKRTGERAWVSVPQVSWKDPNGKVKYRALLSIPGELKQRIEVAILSAWEKELDNGRDQRK